MNHLWDWKTGRYKTTSTSLSLFCFRMNVLWYTHRTGSEKDITLQGQGRDKVPGQDRPGQQHTDPPQPHRTIPLSRQGIRFVPSHPDLPHSLHLTSGLFYCQLIRRGYYSEVRELSTERNVQYMTVRTKNKFSSCVCLSVCGVFICCVNCSHMGKTFLETPDVDKGWLWVQKGACLWVEELLACCYCSILVAPCAWSLRISCRSFGLAEV